MFVVKPVLMTQQEFLEDPHLFDSLIKKKKEIGKKELLVKTN